MLKEVMKVGNISLALALLLSTSLTNAVSEKTNEINSGRELGLTYDEKQARKEARAAKRAAKKAAMEENEKGMYFQLAYAERECAEFAGGEENVNFKCELYKLNKYGGEKVGDTYYDCEVVAIDDSTINYKFIWDCTITDYIGGGIGGSYIRNEGMTPDFREVISGSFATVGGINEAKGIRGQLDVFYDKYKMEWFHVYYVEAWNMSGLPVSEVPTTDNISIDTCRTKFVDICRPSGVDTFTHLTICEIYRQNDDETPGTVFDEGKYLTEECVVMDCIFDNTSAQTILGLSGGEYGSNVGSNSQILFCNTDELQMAAITRINEGQPLATNLVIECVLEEPCVLSKSGNQVFDIRNFDDVAMKNIRILGGGVPPTAVKSGDTAINMGTVCGTVLIDTIQIINQFSDDTGGGLQIQCTSAKRPTSTVTIRNSLFQGNRADGSARSSGIDEMDGGGIYLNRFSQVTINNSIFNGNEANGNGGGFYLTSVDALSVTSSTFTNNMVDDGVANLPNPGGQRFGGLGYSTGSLSSFTGCNNIGVGNADNYGGCTADEFYKSGPGCTNINSCI